MMGRVFGSLKTGLGTARELISNMWEGPFWFLVPFLLILMPAAVLFIFLQSVPYVAPFVYTIF